jgi:hypothetical protein
MKGHRAEYGHFGMCAAQNMLRYVSDGSFASFPRCPSCVRLCSKTGSKADIARGRIVPGTDIMQRGKNASLDHFVGATEQRQRHGEAERLGRLQIDDEAKRLW